MLQSVRLEGPGVGSVVRVVAMELAPERIGKRWLPYEGAVGGAYSVYPPAVPSTEGGCDAEHLVRLAGFSLPPGSLARLFFIIRFVRPGHWHVRHVDVFYQMGKIDLHQQLAYGYDRLVSRTARYIPPVSWQAPCARYPGIRLLPDVGAPVRPRPRHGFQPTVNGS
jgi:hypothetical protein